MQYLFFFFFSKPQKTTSVPPVAARETSLFSEFKAGSWKKPVGGETGPSVACWSSSRKLPSLITEKFAQKASLACVSWIPAKLTPAPDAAKHSTRQPLPSMRGVKDLAAFQILPSPVESPWVRLQPGIDAMDLGLEL